MSNSLIDLYTLKILRYIIVFLKNVNTSGIIKIKSLIASVKIVRDGA